MLYAKIKKKIAKNTAIKAVTPILDLNIMILKLRINNGMREPLDFREILDTSSLKKDPVYIIGTCIQYLQYVKYNGARETLVTYTP